jgi:hypothetical protein
MGTAFTRTKTSPASWDAFNDVDAFVDAVLVELAAVTADGTRSTGSGPKSPLTGAALRKAIMAIWCVCFCGMQWRVIGQLCDIPLGTFYTLFARWTRLGLWHRLLNRLIVARPSRVWGSRTLWLAGSVSIPLFIKRKTRPIPDPPLVKHLTDYTLFDRTPPNS